MPYLPSQRSRIHRLLTDNIFLDRVLEEVSTAVPSDSAALAQAKSQAVTPAERVKAVLTLLASAEPRPNWSAATLDLRRICRFSEQTLNQLNSSEALWCHVFRHLGRPLVGPLTVELLRPAGRCNHVFRLRDSSGSYIARYHDPVGKDFLQRHEPRTAVETYCAAAELFETHLDHCKAVNPILPSPALWPAGAEGPEESKPLFAVVGERLIVMRDYSVDHDTLDDYNQISPRIEWKAVIDCIAAPQSEWHSRSRGMNLYDVSKRTRWLTLDRLQRLVRFSNPDAYSNWLLSRNWIRTRISTPRAVFPATLIDLTPEHLASRWRTLAEESSTATRQFPSLAHFDYTPHNCFLPRERGAFPVVFDFDYVSAVDPAYDAGISLASLVRTLSAHPAVGQPSDLAEVVAEFVARYRASYSRACGRSERTVELPESTLNRARAFAGFALAAGIDFSDYPPTVRDQLATLVTGLISDDKTVTSVAAQGLAE